MKRFGGLYQQIYAFDNLLKAAQKAQRGKRTKPNVARFNFHLERELLTLRNALKDKTWQPGPYVSFFIYEPKKRLISAAPYEDRVVHHALCNLIEPIFERTFIYDSYANRKSKGTHRAVNRFTEFCRKNRYVLKCDIRKYFPSIDHEILYGLIARKLKDPDVLWLIRRIIDSSNPQEPVQTYFPGDDLFTPFERRKGIPIGNLTSQFFANIYLNGFDHFVKRKLGCRYYLRYVDDFVALSNDKGLLHEVKDQMAEYLATLRLKLHDTKCQVFPVTQGASFLGYRIFPTHRLLKRQNVRRFQKRLQVLQHQFRQDSIRVEKVGQSIQSWIAHASHADTYGLRRKVLSGVTFQRG
jgi:retron-type reverse transcriptase